MSAKGLSESFAINNERFRRRGQDVLVLKELANRFELQGITYLFLGQRPLERAGGALLSTFLRDCDVQQASLRYDEIDAQIMRGFQTLLPQPWSIHPRLEVPEPNAALTGVNLKVIDQGVTVPVHEENRGTALVSITDRNSDTGRTLLDESHLPEIISFAALLHGAVLD